MLMAERPLAARGRVAGNHLLYISSRWGEMDRQTIEKCIRLLEEEYGVPQRHDIDPVDLLIMTILSQNTSDVNSLRAFAQLKSAFPSHEQILAAPEKAVAESIRGGGLADMKAGRIQQALALIRQREGRIDIGFLADMADEDAMDFLLSMPGVGPKTASVVLLFAFGKSFLPVDTHVYRLSRRLGLLEDGVRMEKAQAALERIVPEDRYLSLHLNLINHGRRVCKARGPRHERCVLRDCCDSFQRGLCQKA
jgi:endonuclease-3